MRSLHLAAVALAGSLCLALEDPRPPGDPLPGDPPPVNPIDRLEAWPEPADRDQLATDVERLRKARTEEMVQEARAGLEAAGAAAAPSLLKALEKEKDPDARKRVTEVLTAVTGAAHTRLLAREFEHRSPEVRNYALRRAAAFPDPGIREPADAALARVLARGDKASEDDRFAAALCATSAGSLAGLPVLMPIAAERWGRLGGEIRAALEAVRGPEATKIVSPWLGDPDRGRKVAALNLLAGCGDASAKALAARWLGAEDNWIRIAAINALRGIVDRDPPIEQLPVFEAIEVAKKWKERL